MASFWFMLLLIFCIAGVAAKWGSRQSIAKMSDEELARADKEMIETNEHGRDPKWVMYHRNVRAEMKKRGLC